ncbi:uncharacterized protein [Ptychodera flava]|uniref:uncharacterized protein n=1 Tax=Ptychodera flava TaxID=63121 RepID=UPI003969ECBC
MFQNRFEITGILMKLSVFLSLMVVMTSKRSNGADANTFYNCGATLVPLSEIIDCDQGNIYLSSQDNMNLTLKPGSNGTLQLGDVILGRLLDRLEEISQNVTGMKSRLKSIEEMGQSSLSVGGRDSRSEKLNTHPIKSTSVVSTIDPASVVSTTESIYTIESTSTVSTTEPTSVVPTIDPTSVVSTIDPTSVVSTIEFTFGMSMRDDDPDDVGASLSNRGSTSSQIPSISEADDVGRSGFAPSLDTSYTFHRFLIILHVFFSAKIPN